MAGKQKDKVPPPYFKYAVAFLIALNLLLAIRLLGEGSSFFKKKDLPAALAEKYLRALIAGDDARVKTMSSSRLAASLGTIKPLLGNVEFKEQMLSRGSDVEGSHDYKAIFILTYEPKRIHKFVMIYAGKSSEGWKVDRLKVEDVNFPENSFALPPGESNDERNIKAPPQVPQEK